MRFFRRHYQGQIYCPKHYKSFLENKWVVYKEYEFHAEDEKAAHFEDLRLELVKKKNLLSYTQTNYKISGDLILTIVKLYVIEEDLESWKVTEI